MDTAKVAPERGAPRHEATRQEASERELREREAHALEVHHKARALQAPGAEIVRETIHLQGEEELKRRSPGLFLSGLAAGLSLGFSMVARAAIEMHLVGVRWAPLVGALGFSVGFVFIIFARQQLFTENTVVPIVPLLRRSSLLGDVARLWAVVLAANLLGAAVFALVTARTEAFSPEMRAEFSRLAHEVLRPTFAVQLLRAVVGGWLIALMVWMQPASGPSKLAMVVIPTWLIAVAHLGHVITGSIEVLHLVFGGEAGIGSYLGGFLLPVLIGNVLGGVLLVAMLNHGQVEAA
jgi:formate/nitrite transporter FocA (FNT family)